MHDGSIWAESEGIEKGSTFYFTLKKGKEIRLSNNEKIVVVAK
jgi:signal transduction histidine kinase